MPLLALTALAMLPAAYGQDSDGDGVSDITAKILGGITDLEDPSELGIECGLFCVKCTGPVCTQCDYGYRVENGVCHENHCRSDQCLKCSHDDMEGDKSCLVCAPREDGAHTYINPHGECKRCQPEFCSICGDDGQCLECIPGFVKRITGQCMCGIEHCDQCGYDEEVGAHCIQCNPGFEPYHGDMCVCKTKHCMVCHGDGKCSQCDVEYKLTEDHDCEHV